MGAQARNYIAALDATTGAATAWNPNASYSVSALAVSGSTVYAGGQFTSIGGQARNGIAALDATTGTATTWNPYADGPAYTLVVSGPTIYAGGGFTTIGGQARNFIAALDATTGAATAWNPNADGSVLAIVVSGSTIYAGGQFNTIGEGARNGIAALEATSGLATAWDPNADGWIAALAVSGSTVYAGGAFSSIGGQARGSIAALDATTGAATAWDPTALPVGVYALAVSGSTVYAAGQFTNIGGQDRNGIAAFDATTGAATAWNPNPNYPDYTSIVYALAVSGSTVYAGGYFTSIGGQPHRYFAAILDDLTTPTLLSLVSARATPDRVELAWFSAPGVSSATVYRRTARDDWEPMGEISIDGTGRLVYEDTRVTAGARYGYRLGLIEAGQEVFLGETWVDVPATLELALAFRSNPTRDLGVAFSLPDDSPARLDLFDVGGRRIASRDVGTLGAGSHIVTLGDGRRFAPGVYLLRLSQGTRSLTARGVVVR
jgi:hypothetical protein